MREELARGASLNIGFILANLSMQAAVSLLLAAYLGPQGVGAHGKERVELVRPDQQGGCMGGRLETLPQLFIQKMVGRLDRVNHSPVDEHEERPEEQQGPQEARWFDGRQIDHGRAYALQQG